MQVSSIRDSLKNLGEEGKHPLDLSAIKNHATSLRDKMQSCNEAVIFLRPKCKDAFKLARGRLDKIINLIDEVEKQASRQDSNIDKQLKDLLVACGKINEAIDKPADMTVWRGQLRKAIPPSRLHYVWFLVLPSTLYLSRSSFWQPKPLPGRPDPPTQCISINETDSKVQLIGEITDNDLYVNLNKLLNIDQNNRHAPSHYITRLSEKYKKSDNEDFKRDIERYMPLLQILNNNTSKSAKPYYVAIAVPFDADNKPSLKALGILHGIDQAQRDLRNELKMKVVIVNDSLEDSSDLKISSLAHAIATKGYSGSQFIGLIGHPSFSNSNILETCYQKYRLPALSLSIRTPLPSSTMTAPFHYFQSLLPDAKKIAEKTADLLDANRRILVFHDNSPYGQMLRYYICKSFKDKKKCHTTDISHYDDMKINSRIESQDAENTANWFLAFDPEQNSEASDNLIQHFLGRQQSVNLYLSNDFFLEHRINNIIKIDKTRKTQSSGIYRIGLWDWRSASDKSQNSNRNASDGDYGEERNWQFINSYNSFKHMHQGLRRVLESQTDSSPQVIFIRKHLIPAMARPIPHEGNSSHVYHGGPLKIKLVDKKMAPQGETSKICSVLLSAVRAQVDCS
jgi:hypothetical protein